MGCAASQALESRLDGYCVEHRCGEHRRRSNCLYKPVSGSPSLRGDSEDLLSLSLSRIAVCEQPLLHEVARFLCDKPTDFAHICVTSELFADLRQGVVSRAIWRELYLHRWPTFFEALSYQGGDDWQRLYQDTLMGNCECVLEVFDREKKLGFAMAAMPARVSYAARSQPPPGAPAEGQGCYWARYLSASSVPPEKISVNEEHRLRFCPSATREQLQPSRATVGLLMALTEDMSSQHAAYPHKVLEGFDGLQVGGSIELQWKMQRRSPFGWWFGQLDKLRFLDDGLAEGTITFRHFPATSRWYSLTVTFGDSQVRECAFGGFTGGVRAVSDSEKKQAMRFFPGELIVF